MPHDPRTLAIVPEWIERHCVVPDGFRRGAPFRLYEFQLLYLEGFYRVRGDARWIPDAPLLASAFVHRRGLLVGPQKLGKNPLIAAQVCAEGSGPVLFAGWAGTDDGYACGDHGCRCGWEYAYEPSEPMGMAWPTPLIQITAFSEKSTDNTYDALRPMIDLGPLADVIPKTGEDFIRLPGGGRIDTVTSSNQSRLGQRVTFVPQDEVGLWTRQNKMAKVADTQWRNLAGMGGRASMTTNAWDPAEGSVAQQEYSSKAPDVYRQMLQPPPYLSYGDRRDRRRIHRIVYPTDTLRENGGHVELDSIEAEAADLAARDQAQAARFYGNVLVPGAGAAVDPAQWDRLAAPRDVPRGMRIGLGFDGSISEDATVLRACTADGYGFTLGTWVRPTESADMARWLAAHPDETAWHVLRYEVNAMVAFAFATFDVGRMLCDPPHWRDEIEVWRGLYGARVLDFPTNQPVRMVPAVDRWRTGIAEGRRTHDGDPVVSEHVKAAHLKPVHLADAEDGRTGYLIVKGGDGRKIDGAIADLLADEAAATMGAPEAPKDRSVHVARYA